MKKTIAFLCAATVALLLSVPSTRAKYTETATYNLRITTSPIEEYTSEYYFNPVGQSFFSVPYDGYYAIQLRGADGGNGYNNPGSGGNGATLTGYLWLYKDEILYVNVAGRGAAGSQASAGAGGSFRTDYGGAEGGSDFAGAGTGGGGGGGAATDIRLGGTALADRIMVAGGGGGGGASGNGITGGAGGNAGNDIVTPSAGGYFMPGQDAGHGNGGSPTGGTGGTGAGPGNGGTSLDGYNGRDGYDYDNGGYSAHGGEGGGQAGGGGGGYYGGGGGASRLSNNGDSPGGGGGGSSYISSEVGQYIPSAIQALLPLPDSRYTSGNAEGYGYCIITYIGAEVPLADPDALTQSWQQSADGQLPAYGPLAEPEDETQPALTATLEAEAHYQLMPQETTAPIYTLTLETEEGFITLHMPGGETETDIVEETLYTALEQLALQAAETAVLHSGNTAVVEVENAIFTATGEGSTPAILELWVEDIHLTAELVITVIDPE